ncbi:hypothetical protein GTQ43_02535 [Nostoc sp. KVJ3]|uniref:hypothetical protein n=1 Tax=Nostoc sp. KVJ3 TaxID=457945 RepID=UPI0022374458|nr:hypothetical protein [Nostoc sp. KVJ3]MCW5312762.1 hypothetical protein [Nostoc sp. KVJ3]
MNKVFLNISLVSIALLPLGLAAKDSSYIPLATGIIPTAITCLLQLNRSKTAKSQIEESEYSD